MNKKLLTAAITAGLMVPGLAAADVQVFGVIQAETGNIDVNYSGAAADTSTTLNDANNGAINGGGPNEVGFKGTEKLGNGLSAYFKINYEFNTASSSGFADPRERIVGLKGDGWHVQFGEMNSLYKTSSHKYDPFVATGGQMRGRSGVSDLHNGYAEDMAEVGFKSGNWSGGIQIKWEDASGESKTQGGVRNRVDAGSWNGRIMYKEKNWEASLAYMDVDISRGSATSATLTGTCVLSGTPGSFPTYGVVCTIGGTGTVGAGGPARKTDYDAWKLAGKWSGNGFTVAAQYESIDANDTNTSSISRPDGGGSVTGNIVGLVGNAGGRAEDYDSLMVAVSYKMSDATSIHGVYANTEHNDINGAATRDMDGDHWTIGVTHNMSKRTSVYGAYMDSSYDFSSGSKINDIDVDGWVVGLRHKF